MNKKKILSLVISFFIVAIAVVCGYMAGSFISEREFVVDIYANLTEDQILDDITKLNWQSKTPDQVTPAEAFQIAEYVLTIRNKYTIVGEGKMDTSLGVSQTSYTEDIKNGDDLYLAFVTYSSIIKIARQCNYNIGGEIVMYEGKPKGRTTADCAWTDKCETYSWEEYKEVFGKYANKNSSYLVGNNSTLSATFNGVKDGLYGFTINLHPVYGTLCYAKQIGMNMGIDPSNVSFSTLSVSFYLTKDFEFVSQEKNEVYTLPYAGVNVTITANINVNYTYE